MVVISFWLVFGGYILVLVVMLLMVMVTVMLLLLLVAWLVVGWSVGDCCCHCW